MPVMLAKENFAAWLLTPEERLKLLKPFPADQMELWPVGKAVGSPKNTGPELIAPVDIAQEKAPSML
jgi:putative SOS response-associated peptidase YedK